jgi:hypothetical protein
MSNNWQQPPFSNSQAENHNNHTPPARRSSSLLRDYANLPQQPQPPPPPMALYHPPSPADPHIQPKAPLWKRSRPLRIAQQMRRRRDRWSRNSPARKIAIGLCSY